MSAFGEIGVQIGTDKQIQTSGGLELVNRGITVTLHYTWQNTSLLC